ncbi:MAG TPA: DUF1295 domain-containing protein [Rhodanobacteraceae bacterium]|nr:DUF1295 domain-containing protein [Rhodanobacteraceae bacterium]
MMVWTGLFWLWLFSAVVMALGWWRAYRSRNATLVDALWALELGIGAVFMAVIGDGHVWPRLALGLAGGLWGARLAMHLARRAGSGVEDGRYQSMRAHWKNSADARFFIFFQTQTLVVVLFALPFVAVATNRDVHVGWLIVGAAIWLVSVVGEALADRQLARFRADPAHRGRTCRRGLWRFSRHPNYFFEWLHWFAYVAFAVGSPLWWLAWIGPLAMYAFLRWFSGIPWTEMQALRTRGDDYRAYQRSTSMLIPWWPSSDSSLSEEQTS